MDALSRHHGGEDGAQSSFNASGSSPTFVSTTQQYHPKRTRAQYKLPPLLRFGFFKTKGGEIKTVRNVDIRREKLQVFPRVANVNEIRQEHDDSGSEIGSDEIFGDYNDYEYGTSDSSGSYFDEKDIICSDTTETIDTDTNSNDFVINNNTSFGHFSYIRGNTQNARGFNHDRTAGIKKRILQKYGIVLALFCFIGFLIWYADKRKSAANRNSTVEGSTTFSSENSIAKSSCQCCSTTGSILCAVSGLVAFVSTAVVSFNLCGETCFSSGDDGGPYAPDVLNPPTDSTTDDASSTSTSTPTSGKKSGTRKPEIVRKTSYNESFDRSPDAIDLPIEEDSHSAELSASASAEQTLSPTASVDDDSVVPRDGEKDRRNYPKRRPTKRSEYEPLFNWTEHLDLEKCFELYQDKRGRNGQVF